MKMTVFCTYCSKLKSHESGEIAAIQRYKSERIERVYQAACGLNLRFVILSGHFGLVRPEQRIPDYDHLLKCEEVPSLTRVVISQIHEYEIDGFVYFTKPLVSNPDLLPYHATLAAACCGSFHPFLTVELEEPSK